MPILEIGLIIISLMILITSNKDSYRKITITWGVILGFNIAILMLWYIPPKNDFLSRMQYHLEMTDTLHTTATSCN